MGLAAHSTAVSRLKGLKGAPINEFQTATQCCKANVEPPICKHQQLIPFFKKTYTGQTHCEHIDAYGRHFVLLF